MKALRAENILLNPATSPLPLDLLETTDSSTSGPVSEEIQSENRVRDILVGVSEPDPKLSTLEVHSITDKKWGEASRKLKAVVRFFQDPNPLRTVQEHADKEEVSIATFYRWIAVFRAARGQIHGFIRSYRLSKERLDPEVEGIIQEGIDKLYHKAERPSQTDTFDWIELRCNERNLESPSRSTVRNRILAIAAETSTRARYGKRTAEEMFGMYKSGFIVDGGPLAVVQMDHTRLDVHVLSEELRLLIGRPWITVAFDVFTRMVVGIHIGLDDPSSLTTGQCLAHAILPKQAYMDSLGVEGEWPCQGIPKLVHADNAMDLRGEMIQRACEMYGMEVQWRIVGRPETGGHIERFMRTLSEAIHRIPGTTFSNPKDRGEYPSETKACITLRELEQYIVTWITGIYHQKPHRGIDSQAPIQRWKEWFRSRSAELGMEAPEVPYNHLQIRMNLLPMAHRSIQAEGIALFGTFYYHDLLRTYIGHTSSGDMAKAGKYLIRYDPRDISAIYLWMPECSEYLRVPWKDMTLRPCSVWEFRRERLRRKHLNEASVDRERIATSRKKLEGISAKAVQLTTKEKRAQERARLHAKNNIHTLIPMQAAPSGSPPIDVCTLTPQEINKTVFEPQDLLPFDID